MRRFPIATARIRWAGISRIRPRAGYGLIAGLLLACALFVALGARPSGSGAVDDSRIEGDVASAIPHEWIWEREAVRFEGMIRAEADRFEGMTRAEVARFEGMIRAAR